MASLYPQFEYFHFHLYYPFSEVERARKILKRIENEVLEELGLQIGRSWEKPVGPHPIGSCQVSVPNKSFSLMTHWFLENREDFDVFVHGVTGDDYRDHTQYVMWIGKEHPLKLSIFKKRDQLQEIQD